MRASGWVAAAAAAALFGAALTASLVLEPPSATSVTLAQGSGLAPDATEPLRVEGMSQAAPKTTATTTSTTTMTSMTTTTSRTIESATIPETSEEAGAPSEGAGDIASIRTGDVAVAHSVADGCRRKQVEWVRREEAGDIDWDRMFPDDEVDDPESVWLEPLPFDGGVQNGTERIVLPDFSAGLDVGTLSNRALLSAVEVCDEAGLLEE